MNTQTTITLLLACLVLTTAPHESKAQNDNRDAAPGGPAQTLFEKRYTKAVPIFSPSACGAYLVPFGSSVNEAEASARRAGLIVTNTAVQQEDTSITIMSIVDPDYDVEMTMEFAHGKYENLVVFLRARDSVYAEERFTEIAQACDEAFNKGVEKEDCIYKVVCRKTHYTVTVFRDNLEVVFTATVQRK